MSVVFVLVPVTLLIAGAAVTAYLWATHRGQFDDLETPAMRILNDDGAPAARDRDPSAIE